MTASTIRLLLIEDNPTDVLLLEDAIAQVATLSIEITHVGRLSAALEKLDEERFDVVLCDLGLPDSQGLDTFCDLHKAHPDVPTLVLTGFDDDATGLRAIQQGAQDYLIKGQMNGHVLARVIRYSIERTQSAAALHESQRFLHSTLNALSSHISVLDENGTIIAVNHAWQRFAEENDGSPSACGVGANYLAACDNAKGIWTEGAEAAARGIREIIAGKLPIFRLEYPCHSPTEQRWFNLRVTRFDGKAPVRVVVAHENITERKLAEETRRESEQRLSGIINATMDAIITMDAAHRIVLFNPAAEQLFGRPSSEVIGQPIACLMPKRFRAMHAEHVRQFAESGVISRTMGASGNVIGLRANGEEFPIEGSISQIEIGGQKLFTSILHDITERQQAQQEIAFQAQLLNEVGQAVIATDPQGLINYWNRYAQKMYGWTAQEAMGQSIISMVVPEEQRDHADGVMEKLRRGERWEGEAILRRRDGSTFAGMVTNTAVLDETGQVRAIIGVSQDITERKRAEEALRASEERFQSIVANVPGMVYQFIRRPDGAVEWPFVSEGCRELFHLEPETFQTHPTLLLESIHPDDRPSFEQSIAVSAQSLTPWNWEGRRLLPEGGVQWVQAISRPQRLPDGGTFWNGLVMDTTARKEAEIERDRFFTLTLDLLGIADGDGYFKRINPAFEATLGFSSEELMAVPFLEFVHPDDRAATSKEMEKITTGEAISQFENRYRCRDGSYKWLQWIATPFEELWYFAARDITEIKKAERTLQKANDELESRVHERTAELEVSMRKMRSAQQEAEAANAAKSEFLSRMSHELRTPLNAILGFGQILQRQELPPLGQESVGHILRGGRHLLDLINEVLDIARVEAGRLEISPEAVMLDDIVPSVCELMRPLAEERGLHLNENARSICDCHVLADVQRLRQILINLLSNAIKYNREGGEVEIYCASRPNQRIAIMVRDTGPGIAPDDLRKIFTPFERLGITDAQVEGTGLGLPLAERLTGMMDGSLSVESVVGSGTTFTLELPEAPPESIPSQTAEEALREYSRPQVEHHYTVLCIEDNPSNLRLMETILADRPEIKLITAIQGGIGLDLALQHEPNLILLDLNLPDMQGSEVMARLQNSAITRDIPIIIISADASPRQKEKLLSQGAKEYLAKPIDIELLLQTLENFLEATS
jgi:PAS domain S-box-containing protein